MRPPAQFQIEIARKTTLLSAVLKIYSEYRPCSICQTQQVINDSLSKTQAALLAQIRAETQ